MTRPVAFLFNLKIGETMDYKNIEDSIKKGTTTVAVTCADGVVVGADSRATMDTFIASTEAIKVNKIDKNIAMTIAGSVGDAEYLVKILKVQNELYKMNENKPLSPTSATSLISLILQETKFAPYYVQLIIAGMNGDVPEIYNLDMAGGYTKEAFTSTGSGSLTALGYLEDVYKKEKTTQEAVKDVVKALKIAMKRDSATGNNIRIAVLTKGSYKEYYGSEVEKLIK